MMVPQRQWTHHHLKHLKPIWTQHQGIFWQQQSQTRLRIRMHGLVMLVWGGFALGWFLFHFWGCFLCLSKCQEQHEKKYWALHLSQENSQHHEFITRPRAEGTLQCGVNFKHVRHPSGRCFITRFNWVCHRTFTKETEKSRQINHSGNIWGQLSEQEPRMHIFWALTPPHHGLSRHKKTSPCNETGT